MKMTEKQRLLVEENIGIVRTVIKQLVKMDNKNHDMEYDDCFQIGCLALCKAAVLYNGKIKFNTFAGELVRHALIDVYRVSGKKAANTVSIDESVGDCNDKSLLEIIPDHKNTENELLSKISYDAMRTCLNNMKSRHSGVVLKGIAAIEFKMQGYTGRDIAKIYHVEPNSVSAWISRAKSRLLKDEEFLKLISE